MPPADDSSQAPKEERDRLEMERNWELRQENVLPLETAWNEGRFYGLALKGSKRLTVVQRVGIFLIGLLVLGSSLTTVELGGLHGAGPSLKSIAQSLPDVPLLFLPVVLLELALGLRLCRVAIKCPPRVANRDPRSHHHAT